MIPPDFRAQGAALAFGPAITLSTVLQDIETPTQLNSLLVLYESLRISRARRANWRSKQMHDICQLRDGPEQRERDRKLREEDPTEGFPNPWADPEFQTGMWGFDAMAVAQRARDTQSGQKGGKKKEKRKLEDNRDVEEIQEKITTKRS